MSSVNAGNIVLTAEEFQQLMKDNPGIGQEILKAVKQKREKEESLQEEKEEHDALDQFVASLKGRIILNAEIVEYEEGEYDDYRPNTIRLTTDAGKILVDSPRKEVEP